MSNDIGVLVLAAGKGTRMKSDTTKMLHKIAGIPLLAHGLHTAQKLGSERMVVVVGHQAEEVKAALSKEFSGANLMFALQAEQLGTAHAVMCAQEQLKGGPSQLFILAGDVPLLTQETLQQMLDLKQTSKAAVCTLSFIVEDTTGYGRILRDATGGVCAIREDRDCDPEEKKVKECNSAIYLVDTEFLLGSLNNIDDNNDQGEFYLTDIVELAAKEGHPVVGIIVDDPIEILGVNDLVQLATLEQRWMKDRMEELMRKGVTFRLPNTTSIDYHVQVGRGAEIGPNCCLKGHTTVGEHATIGACSHIENGEVPAKTILPPHSSL